VLECIDVGGLRYSGAKVLAPWCSLRVLRMRGWGIQVC